MRRAHSLLVLPFLVFVFGCGSDDACVFDSDCADFMMVCVEQKCVLAGSIDSGPRPQPDAGGSLEDAGPSVPDASGEFDAGVDDAGMTDDGGSAACPELEGTWTAESTDPASCGEGEIVISTDDAIGCGFTATGAFEGTFRHGAETELTGDFTIAGSPTECMGVAGDENITLTCDNGCEFTLTQPPPAD